MNNHHRDPQHRFYSNSSCLVRPALLFFCPPAGGAVVVTLRCPPTHSALCLDASGISESWYRCSGETTHSHVLSARQISVSLFFATSAPSSSSSSSRITNTRRKQPHLLPRPGVKRCAGLEKLQRWQLRPLVCFSVRVKSRSVILCSRVEEEEEDVEVVVDGDGGSGWHTAELHGKEGGVARLWTQTSMRQTQFDRRHHKQKKQAD